MQIKIAGRIRGLFAGNSSENREDEQFHMNSRGDQLVAQGLPERTEIVRLGNSWGCAIPTASAFTFVNAWPTTRAELVLYNGEDKGGPSYIIDKVWMSNITSMAAAQPMTLLAQIAAAALAIAAAADNAAVLRYHLSGNLTNYGGRAALALANTAFALANKWSAVASVTPSPTTNLGAAVMADLYGRFIVPPGAAFCIAGLAGTAAGTAVAGIEWHEAQIIRK